MAFSQAAKSNIDIIVPTLGAGAAFYYLKNNQELKMERLLIYTAIAWFLLYLLTSKITKSIRAKAILQPDVALPNPNGEYSALNNFDAVTYSTRLHNDIDGVRWGQFYGGWTDIALYKEIELMSQNQLVAVANQYKNDWGESLVSAMKGETYPNLLGDGTQDRVNSIITRLQSLGIR